MPTIRGYRILAAVTALLTIAAACSSASPAPTPGPVASSGSSAASPASPRLATPSVAPSCAPDSATLGRLARSGPPDGAWVGMNLDWGSETVADVTSRLGGPPADVVSFVGFPLAPADDSNLDAAAGQARDARAVLVVTLEPWAGLGSVTDTALAHLVERLAGYGDDGLPTIVRFAHEMNGSWYPWGQDPTTYVAAFRRVADAVHAGAPTAALLWAPNQGDGYPYSGGKYEARRGSRAARALDTNGNGHLDKADDPYAPYWPGGAYVDWVGMSLYHWGTAYPWGENEVPAKGKFTALVAGATTTGVTVPDFYAAYAERYDKPLAIVETGALYRPGGGGATEAAIKKAWLGQVLSPATRARFPRIRLVNWFEWKKNETEVGGVVDWRIAEDPRLRAAFVAAVEDGFTLGPAVATAPGCGPG